MGCSMLCLGALFSLALCCRVQHDVPSIPRCDNIAVTTYDCATNNQGVGVVAVPIWVLMTPLQY
jgi:hypothetical protein